MFHFLSTNKWMLRHISSGNLVSSNFVHSRRSLDHYVILVGKKGTLHITQGDVPYSLGPGEFLLLYPGQEHYGHRTSEGELSYYWCHFEFQAPCRSLLDRELEQHLFLMHNDTTQQHLRDVYLIPEYGDIASVERTHLIFHQLLDLARRGSYSSSMVDCALSMLGMEITQNFLDDVRRRDSDLSKRRRDNGLSKRHRNIAEIMEWLRVNYWADLSVQMIAERFSYNPDYLSTTFREVTGSSLLKYVHKLRISAAKRLLLDTSLSVKEIALRCGFHEDKSFMKLFKQMEEVTPSQYRTAFFQRKVVKS